MDKKPSTVFFQFIIRNYNSKKSKTRKRRGKEKDDSCDQDLIRRSETK